MWRKVLDSILDEIRRYGYTPQEPCDECDRARLSNLVVDNFGVNLSNEYLNLLSLVNGLDWNGLVVFSSRRVLISGFSDRFIEGIVDQNLAYRDNPDMAHYFVFGDDGTVLFALDCRSGRYVVITSVGLTELESYATCSDMFYAALSSHM